jgi:hypothetical protein
MVHVYARQTDGTRTHEIRAGLHVRFNVNGFSKFDYAPFMKLTETVYFPPPNYAISYWQYEVDRANYHGMQALLGRCDLHRQAGPLSTTERADLGTICDAMTCVSNSILEDGGGVLVCEISCLPDDGNVFENVGCDYNSTTYAKISRLANENM